MAIVATYPKLLGLVLTVPHLEMGVVSFSKSDTLQNEFNENKIFLDLEIGKYQYESIIVWKNLHADHKFPKEILYAIKNYSSNLISLELSSK